MSISPLSSAPPRRKFKLPNRKWTNGKRERKGNPQRRRGWATGEPKIEREKDEEIYVQVWETLPDADGDTETTINLCKAYPEWVWLHVPAIEKLQGNVESRPLSIPFEGGFPPGEAVSQFAASAPSFTAPQPLIWQLKFSLNRDGSNAVLSQVWQNRSPVRHRGNVAIFVMD